MNAGRETMIRVTLAFLATCVSGCGCGSSGLPSQDGDSGSSVGDSGAAASPEASAPLSPCDTGKALRESASSSEEFNGPFKSWKSVKDYGAVGDGATDDTAAIQRALDDLKAVLTNSWSTLYFPPGRYRITSQLMTTRTSDNDYLGTDIVGDDPETTSLVWDGPAGGTLLKLDAWYNKLSRLTFDGKGKAAVGVARAPAFATYGELSDLQFQDFTDGGLLLGDGSSNGIAEQAVVRDRFYRCKYALGTWNYNTLDIYVWNSYFEDSDEAIRNSTGAFHAYQNRFVRSRTADLAAYTNMQTSIVGNTSVGSAAFLANFGASAQLQGNLVYVTAPDAFDLTNVQASLIDNVIVLPNGFEASRAGSSALLVGNVFVGSNRWPVRPTPLPFNHGTGGSYVVDHEIEKAVDGDPTTYSTQGLWGAVAEGLRWNTPYGTQRTVSKYAIVANGYAVGDYPSDFGLYGSNDWGTSWTTLDERTGETLQTRQRKEYAITGPTAYAMYELRVLKTAAGAVPGPGGFFSLGEVELLDAANTKITSDPAGLLTGCNEPWGNHDDIDSTFLPDGQCGAAPALEPWPFVRKVQRKVFDVEGFTGEAIQQAINQAAAEPGGSKPVVHLPKGQYKVSTSVTVPPSFAMSIVGDGGSPNGTVLSTDGAGPILILAGPSRATVRDLEVSSESSDGILIEKADQIGGRVYGNQWSCGGFGGPQNVASVAFDVDGVEQSDVTMTAFGMSSFLGGVRATGGAVRSIGGSAPGQVAFLTGASSGGTRNYDVRKNGQLAVTAVWYEGDDSFVGDGPILDLESDSSGVLSLAASTVALSRPPPVPFVRTNGFSGSLALLNVLFSRPDDSPYLEFQGAGEATRAFGSGNAYVSGPTSAPFVGSPTALWRDTTSPSCELSQICINGVSDQTNGRTAVAPDADFVRAQLSLLRNLRIEQPADRPPGVTDVKIFRVGVGIGNKRTACAIHAN